VNKLIIQLRNGSSGSPALMIMRLSFIKVGKEKAAKQQGLLFLHARAYLPQTSDLIACTRHCASIITACCMCHAVVLRKHQRLLHAACLLLSGKKSSDFMRRFGGCGAHRSFTSRKHCHLGREHRERRQHARAFKKAGDRDLKATMQPRRQEVGAVSLLQKTARSRASICAGAGLGLNKQGLEVA
jgi:hypothetical protein